MRLMGAIRQWNGWRLTALRRRYAALAAPAPTALEALRQQYLYANQHRRLILTLLCGGSAIYFSLTANPARFAALEVLAGWTLTATLLPAVSSRLRNEHQLLALIWAQLFFELGFITRLLRVAGGPHPPVALYFFTLFFAFLVLPPRRAGWLSACALAEYLGLVWLNSRLRPPAPAYPHLIFEIGILLLLAYSFSRMAKLLRLRARALTASHRALERVRRDLVRHQHQLEELVRERTRELGAAHAELRRQHRELLRLHRLQGDFVANISHDMCTPLTSIRSYTDLLRSDPAEPPDTQREFLGIIHDESLRLEQLILDLLELAHIQAGRSMLRLQPLRLDELALSAAAEMREAAKREGVELRLELSDHFLPRLLGDERRLLQVLIRLLQNALKFARRGTTVRLGAGRADNELRLWVCDAGPGIPPEEREKIFERFYQVADPRHPKPRGAGLGLALCHEIVTRHGGRIWVECPAEGGSRFVCGFPMEQPSPAAFAHRR